MFLWINLILALLETSCNLYELSSNVDALPKDLEDMLVIFNNLSTAPQLRWVGSLANRKMVFKGTKSFLIIFAVDVPLETSQEFQGYSNGFSFQKDKATSRNTMFSLGRVYMKTA